MWNRRSFIIICIFLNIFRIPNGECQSVNINTNKPVLAFNYPLADTSFICRVNIISNPDSVPFQYSSIIVTPVCNDGLCQTLEIELHWNLIGNFTGYDTIEEKPLTKFDHLPFTSMDYEKLQTILGDQNSVLERKKLDELFDKEKVRVSEKEDATTGATANAVKNAIVEGALYSTYKLWHIANGEIKAKIREHTESIYNPLIRDQLIQSGDYRNQLFAIRLFTDDEYDSQFNDMLNLIKTSNSLVEMYILKKLPNAILVDSTHQLELANIFSEMDINGKSLFLGGLHKIENVCIASLQLLSAKIDDMTVGQLQDYLLLLTNSQYLGDAIIAENLKNASTIADTKGYYILNYIKKANFSD